MPSLQFQGKGNLLRGRDNIQNKQTAEQETVDAHNNDLMERRDQWFRTHRPKEKPTSVEEGYVTTPGCSEAEDSDAEDGRRPSARRHARETGQAFDSFRQAFRKLSPQETHEQKLGKGDMGHA